MKINWNQKYTTIAVYSFIVVASCIIFYLILSGIDQFNQLIRSYFSVLSPFLYGFVIAYLINYPLNFFTKYLKKISSLQKVEKSTIHLIALILAYTLSGLLVYLFIMFVLPQLVSSVVGIVEKIPEYIQSTTHYIENLLNDTSFPPKVADFIYDRWAELAEFINNGTTALISKLFIFLKNTVQIFWNMFLGIIISVYLLAEKDRFISLAKKVNYSIFNQKAANKIIKISIRAYKIFSNFLGGKILDSAIIGLIAFIVLSIFKMPYTVLISFIIGVTNIIPFFGPFIGAIPSFIIIFFESPIMALWFLVIVLILQQVDGNIIGPKILGDSLGISPFWILFAVLVGGKILGVIGLIIGVPLFVLVYSILKDIMEERLKARGLPVETDEYRYK